jgi:hypothetical protein
MITNHPNKRQIDRKGRARTFSFAEHTHAAAVEIHELMNNRESESEPTVNARGAGVCLAETIENMRQKIFADAHA